MSRVATAPVPVPVSAPLSDLTNTHNSHINININININSDIVNPAKPISLTHTTKQIPTSTTTPEPTSTNKDADITDSHMTDQQTTISTPDAVPVSVSATAPAAASSTLVTAPAPAPATASVSTCSSSSSSSSASMSVSDVDDVDEASSAIRAEVLTASAGKSSDECVKLAEQYQKQGKHEHQIITLQQTLQKAVVEHGELALQCAPLYYKYGAALLEWYMKQSTQAVLGEAMRAREGGDSNGAAGSSTDEDLELAWENLDVARVIYAAQIDKMDKEAQATATGTSTSTSTSSDAAASPSPSPSPSRHSLCLGLASVLESIGDASMEMEQFPVAYLDYGRGLAILQSDPECPPYHRSRAVLHSQMAVVALYQQNLVRAQYHYQHAANVFATRVMHYATRIQQAKHQKYQIHEQIPQIKMQGQSSSSSSSKSESESVSSSITSAPTELVYTSPLLERIYTALGLKNTHDTILTTTPTSTTASSSSSSSTPTPTPLGAVEQDVEEIKECMEILEDLEERIVDLGEQAQNQAKVATSSGSAGSLSSSSSSTFTATRFSIDADADAKTDADADADAGFAAGVSPSSSTSTSTSTNTAVAAAAPFAFLMANGYDPTTSSSSSSITSATTAVDAPTTVLVPKRKPKASPAPVPDDATSSKKQKVSE